MWLVGWLVVSLVDTGKENLPRHPKHPHAHDLSARALQRQLSLGHGCTDTEPTDTVSDAAAPEMASPLIDRFEQFLKDEGVERVESGVFGADMSVALCNEGPVTIWLDSETMKRSK